MRVLITGGAGFIGTALANRLFSEGHHVRVFDNLSAGNPANLHSDIHFTRGDVMDKPMLWSVLNRVDCVYHLAARVSIPESIQYPTEYNTTNVGGTVALMEAIRDAGVKRVVLASSGTIYGEQRVVKVTENLFPLPTSPYGVSKLCAEHYVLSIGKLWGIETVILRIFNTYGPGQSFSLPHSPVISQFIQEAIAGGSIIVHGDGQQVRDFVYIDDVVTGLVAATTTQQANHQIINIGSGEGTSINQLIKLIKTVTNHKLQLLYVNAKSAGVSKLIADISLAKKLLDYQPKTNLQEGLERLLQLDARFGK